MDPISGEKINSFPASHKMFWSYLVSSMTLTVFESRIQRIFVTNPVVDKKGLILRPAKPHQQPHWWYLFENCSCARGFTLSLSPYASGHNWFTLPTYLHLQLRTYFVDEFLSLGMKINSSFQTVISSRFFGNWAVIKNILFNSFSLFAMIRAPQR